MTKKCKSCQSEIDSKAKKCPHCQSDQRNWFARHPILTGILALFAIGIITSAIGGASNSGKSTPAAPDNSSANTTNSNTQSQPTAMKAAPQVLLDLTGSGTKSTQKFTAGGDWDLN